MMRKHLRNQLGLSLLELLATIAISSLIIGILSTVLISSINNNKITQSHIDLRQEANLIVIKLRNIHGGENHQNQTKYWLNYEGGNIHIVSEDGDIIDTLTSEKYAIKSKLENGILIENDGKPLTSEESLLVDRNSPLIVTLKLESGKKEFEIDTVIDREVAFDPGSGNNDDDDDDDDDDDGGGGGGDDENSCSRCDNLSPFWRFICRLICWIF